MGKDTILGANLGRIEIPFALYNATRDRVDTRPSIALPQSIYIEGTNFRDYLLTGDGGMLYGLHRLTKKARIETKVAVARSSFGHISGLDNAILVSGWGDYVYDDALRLRVSMLHSEHDGTQLTYPVLSAQYILSDRWTFSAEAGKLRFNTPAGSVGTTGVYGQVEYAVNKDLTLFCRYDYLKFDLDTPVPLVIDDDRLRAQSFTIGMGYQITKNLRLNGEYSFTDGTAYLNSAENRGIGGGDYSTLAAMVSVRF